MLICNTLFFKQRFCSEIGTVALLVTAPSRFVERPNLKLSLFLPRLQRELLGDRQRLQKEGIFLYYSSY